MSRSLGMFTISVLCQVAFSGCSPTRLTCVAPEGVTVAQPGREVREVTVSSLGISLCTVYVDTEEFGERILTVFAPCSPRRAQRLLGYAKVVMGQHKDDLTLARDTVGGWVRPDRHLRITRCSDAGAEADLTRLSWLDDQVLYALLNDIRDTGGGDLAWALGAAVVSEEIAESHPVIAGNLLVKACSLLRDWAKRVVIKEPWVDFSWIGPRPTTGLSSEQRVRELKVDWKRLVDDVRLEYSVSGGEIRVSRVLYLVMPEGPDAHRWVSRLADQRLSPNRWSGCASRGE